jgi:hypothetical protein
MKPAAPVTTIVGLFIEASPGWPIFCTREMYRQIAPFGNPDDSGWRRA